MKLQQVSGKSILFVMAAEAEYGEHLRQRFTPLITGVGPVEAAVELAAALGRLKHEDMLPDLVVSLGSAGSAKLPQTEVYQASSVSYRDMDASPLGFEKGITPFLDLPAVVELTIQVPGIASASQHVVAGRYASLLKSARERAELPVVPIVRTITVVSSPVRPTRQNG